MRQFHSTVFCPVCGSERELPHVRVRLIPIALKSSLWACLAGVGAGLLGGWWIGALAATFLGALSFLIGEVVETLRGKQELRCPVCAFDPALYRRAPEEAKQRCMEKLKAREEVFLKKWQSVKQQRGYSEFV